MPQLIDWLHEGAPTPVTASAAGVLFSDPDGYMLFLRRQGDDHPGCWALPGGGIESGESPSQAAARECEEEIGASPNMGEALLLHRDISEDGVDFHTFHSAVDEAFHPTLNHEHDDFCWAKREALPHPLHPGVAKMFGEDCWKTVEHALDEFREADHPRDDAGKFTDKDGGAAKTFTQGVIERHRREAREAIGSQILGIASAKYDLHDEPKPSDEDDSFEESVFSFAGKQNDAKQAREAAQKAREEYEAGHNAAYKKAMAHLKETQDIHGAEKMLDDAHKELVAKRDAALHDTLQSIVKPAILSWIYALYAGASFETFLEDEFSGGGEAWEPLPDGYAHPSFAPGPALTKSRSHVGVGERAFAMDALALDRASVRTYDADRRLHVALTNISKANVCGYLGNEIPGWEDLGLAPNQIYNLWRHPDELAKAAGTFNNLPLLSEHVPVHASDWQPELVCGATGSDAVFNAPYLQNSLVIWAHPQIEAIENGSQREVSCGYRYTPKMQPGVTPQGERFDGVMTAIIGNHVALVEQGRAGPDVVVGDGIPELNWNVVEGALLAL